MKKLFCFLVFGLFIISCNSKKTNIRVIKNDFESIKNWVDAPNLEYITDENAKSGFYSIKVNKDIEFANIYKNEMAILSTNKFSEIELKYDLYITDKNNNHLIVIEVLNQNYKSIFWYSVPVNKIKTQVWQNINSNIKLPENLQPSDILKIYFWNNASHSTSYLDNFEIIIKK
jgi:hypothetical protein